MKCFIKNCFSYDEMKKPGISFFRFPQNKWLREKWIAAAGSGIPRNHDVVCSRHFRRSDIKVGATKCRLERNAIPSIFATWKSRTEIEQPSSKEEKAENETSMTEMKDEHFKTTIQENSEKQNQNMFEEDLIREKNKQPLTPIRIGKMRSLGESNIGKGYGILRLGNPVTIIRDCELDDQDDIQNIVNNKISEKFKEIQNEEKKKKEDLVVIENEIADQTKQTTTQEKEVICDEHLKNQQVVEKVLDNQEQKEKDEENDVIVIADEITDEAEDNSIHDQSINNNDNEAERCCIDGCPRRTAGNNSFLLDFPKNPKYRLRWKMNIPRFCCPTALPPNAKICVDHFDKKKIISKIIHTRGIHDGKRVRSKVICVPVKLLPTIFPKEPELLEPMIKRKIKSPNIFKAKFGENVSIAEQRYYEILYRNPNTVCKKKVHCTVCMKHIGTAPVALNIIRMHPLLRVTMCSDCFNEYYGRVYKLGPEKKEYLCRWCGNNATVACSKCVNGFCRKCIINHAVSKNMLEIQHNKNWECYVCNPREIWKLRAQHWALARFIEEQKREIENLSNPDEMDRLMRKDLSSCCTTGNINLYNNIGNGNNLLVPMEAGAEYQNQNLRRIDNTMIIKKLKMLKRKYENKNQSQKNFKRTTNEWLVGADALPQRVLLGTTTATTTTTTTISTTTSTSSINKVPSIATASATVTSASANPKNQVIIRKCRSRKTDQLILKKYDFSNSDCGDKRNQLQRHIFSAVQVCEQLGSKMEKLTKRESYAAIKDNGGVIDVYAHIMCLFEYVTERFQTLQSKCKDDMNILEDLIRFGVPASAYIEQDDDIEIVESPPKATDTTNKDGDVPYS